MKRVLKCGCTPTSKLTASGGVKYDPPLDTCYHGTTEFKDEQPDLHNRSAKCTYCGSTVASRSNLAFFEYKGDGSYDATNMCECGFGIKAHTEERRSKNSSICNEFKSRGAAKHDRYYCGCRGWD